MSDSDYYYLRSIKNILELFFFIALIVIMYLFRSIFIPLFIALFLAMLIQPILAWFEKKRVPSFISMPLIFTIFGILMFLTTLYMTSTLNRITTDWNVLGNEIEMQLVSYVDKLETVTDPKLAQKALASIIQALVETNWPLFLKKNFENAVGNFAFGLFLTILFFIGFVSGIQRYENYLNYVSGTKKNKGNKLLVTFLKVKSSIVTYIKVKTLMSIGTGLTFAGICYVFNIDYALFWGFNAFAMHYIPTIGVLLAIVPPLLISITVYDNLQMILLLFLLFNVAHIFWANFIEPMFLGKQLKLNFVTVIFALVFWGTLFGPIGLVFSVPFTVLVRTILIQNPDSLILAKMMGKGGIE
ncbi:AI-2E family transporter [Bacteroidota bacterium]